MFILYQKRHFPTFFVLMLLIINSVVLVAPISAQDACQVNVASQHELVNAITDASTNCTGGATITLTATIETLIGEFTDVYNQGSNAFPVITSTIHIDGGGFMIVW